MPESTVRVREGDTGPTEPVSQGGQNMEQENVDRVLGRLQEFKDQTLRELAEIRKDVKALQKFKWRVAGGVAVLSFILTGFIEVVHMILKKGG